ncbi:MAG: ABC transporter permease [Bacteroidaceae bacterium]|nr:ABC transporter permease [Bacteroidaceae bacterium]
MKTLLSIFGDKGVLLLAVIVPLVYPFLYSWIYTNEVVREVPVCVVDMSKSKSSRQFIQKLDATPDIDVAYLCTDMKEAERKLAEQKAYGIVFFPYDYEQKTARLEQSTISAYIDMSFLLYYKAIYITLTNLTLEASSKIQLKLAQNTTRREDKLQENSIKMVDHQLFNKTGGYGNFLLQAVIVILIQQTLVLAVCMRAGWRRQKAQYTDGKYASTPSMFGDSLTKDFLSTFFGYGLLYIWNAAYVLLLTPKFFGFSQHITVSEFCIFVVPTLFAMLCFAMALSTMFKKREDCMVCIVFSSLPMLFLVGISWPEVAIPEFWEYVAWFIPSTPAARAFVRLNEMNSTIQDVYPYLAALIVQGIFYMAVFFIVGARRKVQSTK